MAVTSQARLAELGIGGEVELACFELGGLPHILRVLERAKPDEICNLAAQSFAGVSWEQPLYTADAGSPSFPAAPEGRRAILSLYVNSEERSSPDPRCKSGPISRRSWTIWRRKRIAIDRSLPSRPWLLTWSTGNETSPGFARRGAGQAREDPVHPARPARVR
jgi:hypothetical protein